METAAGLIKLKSSAKEHVEDWCNTMKKRRDEALQTLRDEGVVVESWCQVEIEGAPYLLWYMRADSIDRVWEIAATPRLRTVPTAAASMADCNLVVAFECPLCHATAFSGGVALRRLLTRRGHSGRALSYTELE